MKRSTEFDGTERRSRSRYPVRLRVRYRTLGKGPVAGVGETVDFSSRGIMVQAQLHHPIGTGSRIEAIVEWPVLLDGTIHLQLVAVGRVVRSGMSGFAISLGRHEFRTMKREPGSVAAETGRREVG